MLMRIYVRRKMFDIREDCGFMDGYDCWVFEHWEFGGGKEVSIRCRREMWRHVMQLLVGT